MKKREQWGSRQGFVLATIGAAVGLGNIWRFSYVAGENGGAVFLFVYLVCVLLVGLPLVVAELSLGRRAQGDAVAAFEIAGNHGLWRHLGWIGAATGSLWTTAETGFGVFFKRFRGEPIGWQAAMLFATTFIVAGGVQRGTIFAILLQSASTL